MRYCAIFAVIALSMPSVADARGKLLATRTVATWDGPETKVYQATQRAGNYTKCRKARKNGISYPRCSKEPLYVKVPKVDLKRHKIIAHLYGPDVVTNPNEQIKEIANSCLISGLAIAGIPAVVTTPIASLPADVIEAGVTTCLQTQNLGANLLEPGFEVTIDREDYFEH